VAVVVFTPVTSKVVTVGRLTSSSAVVSCFSPVNFRNYPDNAIMAVKAVADGKALAGIEVAAFADDECRTAAVTNDEGIAFLTIPGDETCELTFKVASDAAAAELPVSAEVIFDDAATGIEDSGTITIDGESESGGNVYAIEWTDAELTKRSVSGGGKLVKVSGDQAEGKKYVRITITFSASDGSSWGLAVAYPVEEDGSFLLPAIPMSHDEISNVVVVGMNSYYNGADWSAYQLKGALGMKTP